ncbi:MAG TPA: hypothetical protein PKY12_03020 [Catalimonadaceae bacterium]|nr:hypothetical protein [Catalimonadaceae bacterium]
MIRIFLLSFYLFPFILFGQVEENAPNPLPITSEQKPKLAGKGIFGMQVIAGASYDRINTGVEAVNSKNSNDREDVYLGPGGGFGLEIYGGKQMSRLFRLGVHAGFQYATGTPEIKDAIIRYRKFYVLPMASMTLPFNENHSLNFGLGGMATFGNSLLIEPPKSVSDPTVEITYQPNFGVASHLYYEYRILEANSFFTGLRFNWSQITVSDVKIGSRKGVLTPDGEKRYNNKNGGGVTFVMGFNFFF